MQFGIFVFVEVQETNWREICKVVNVMGILYFYENFFALRKSSFPSWPYRGFSEIFLSNLRCDVFNWSSLFNMQYAKIFSLACLVFIMQ